MYCPASFREDRPEVLHGLIRAHPLGTLVTNGRAGLIANLVPFTLVEREGSAGTLRAHLARANDQLQDLREGGEALVIFQGPHAYITPTWYATKQEHGRVVPTWNYVVVQARGRPRVIDDGAWIREQIDALTTQQERERAHTWAVDDAPPAFVAAQLRAIAGVEIPIERIDGKWKVSQNQPPANQAGVVAGLSQAASVSVGIDELANYVAGRR